MDQKKIIQALNETGILLELLGENYFKARAYYQAAEIIAGLPEDVIGKEAGTEPAVIPGLGPAITRKVAELIETGRLSYLEKLKEQVPPGLPALLKIPGLGAKRINALWKKAGITSLAELEQACRENRLAGISGFGVKTQEKILEGLLLLHRYEGYFLWFEVIETATELQSILEQVSGVIKVAMTGKLRRRLEILTQIELVVSCESESKTKPALLSSSGLELREGEQCLTGNFRGYPVCIYLCEHQEYGTTLWRTTGSETHIEAVKAITSETGEPAAEEAVIYERAGLPFIPPELREDGMEVTAAKEGILPRLVEKEDLKGVFHVHTTASDGVHTLEEMVKGAVFMGWQYLGIADHSQSAFYAGGLKIEALWKQWSEMEDLQNKYNIKILKGIESDILPDGSLDYPPEVLERFDFVVGSVHSNFRMGKEAMTGRICKALADPYLTILGHPSGRILLTREPYEIDMAEIIKTAAKYNKILEINANPYRLDLDWRYCRTAKALGVKVAVNPDAHNRNELGLVVFGVGVARKGWMSKEDVINTWEWPRIKEFIRKPT